VTRTIRGDPGSLHHTAPVTTPCAPRVTGIRGPVAGRPPTPVKEHGPGWQAVSGQLTACSTHHHRGHHGSSAAGIGRNSAHAPGAPPVPQRSPCPSEPLVLPFTFTRPAGTTERPDLDIRRLPRPCTPARAERRHCARQCQGRLSRSVMVLSGRGHPSVVGEPLGEPVGVVGHPARAAAEAAVHSLPVVVVPGDVPPVDVAAPGANVPEYLAFPLAVPASGAVAVGACFDEGPPWGGSVYVCAILATSRSVCAEPAG
jgi:hypothetical protein